MDSDKSYTAVFKGYDTYLHAQAWVNGYLVNPLPIRPYEYGTQVGLMTANPKGFDGYQFKTWAKWNGYYWIYVNPIITIGHDFENYDYALFEKCEYTATYNPNDHGSLLSGGSEQVLYLEDPQNVPAITEDTGYDYVGMAAPTAEQHC